MRYLFLFLIAMVSLASGQTVKISGVVKSPSGENLPYATISDSVNKKAVYADNSGYFSITTNGPACSLKFSHVTYSPVTLGFFAQQDTFVTVELTENEIPEVLVKGTSLAQQAMLGVNFMEGRTIQNIPSFFGEPDLVKSMTTLPGIAGGIDLYSGIYVRGGNRDQNLFLVDGARYYTTSQFGGYFSLFNPDIISHVDIYKGIAPAKYGDGVSSVVDVSLSGGGDVPKLNVDVGTLRSGFHFESKGDRKVYVMLAGRFSQIDLISGNTSKKIDDFKDLSDGKEFPINNFWDLDGKISFKPSPRTTIALNGHVGKDEISSFSQGFEYFEELGQTRKKESYGNYTDNHNLTLNVRHLFPSRVSLKNTTYYTYYNLTQRNDQSYYITGPTTITKFFERNTYVKDLSEKIEINMPIGDKHFGKVGFQFSSFTVNPSVGKEYNEILSIDSVFGYNDQKALEGAIFIDENFKLSPKTTLKMGIRSSFLNSNDTSYFSFEPRILVSHEFAPDWSLKFGYSKNSQPIHVLVNMNGYFEKESWILSDINIKPQTANQFSGGMFGILPGTSIELSLEMYYKKMNNLLFLNPVAYDSEYAFDYLHKNGEGRSYGGEMLIQKTNGKIQWSIAYTLAWSVRRFPTISDGDWFNSDFDRRHNLNIGFHYFSGKKNSWNFNYIYQSGRPFTMPVAYVQQTRFYRGFYILQGPNNARTPPYSRFDISYKRKCNMLWGRKSELTLSVINLFANKNPVGMYVSSGKLYMSSLFVVIPSVNFKLYILK